MLFEFFSSGTPLKLLYGLGFMFFTLLIASFSDLRKMNIDRELFILWLGVTGVMLFYDFYHGISWLKWIIILVLGILSWRGVGKVFSLARADVVAISAVCSILDTPYILLFYVILLLVNKLVLYPVNFFKKNKYPFMPVILVSLIIIILVLGVVKIGDIITFLTKI